MYLIQGFGLHLVALEIKGGESAFSNLMHPALAARCAMCRAMWEKGSSARAATAEFTASLTVPSMLCLGSV